MTDSTVYKNNELFLLLSLVGNLLQDICHLDLLHLWDLCHHFAHHCLFCVDHYHHQITSCNNFVYFSWWTVMLSLSLMLLMLNFNGFALSLVFKLSFLNWEINY